MTTNVGKLEASLTLDASRFQSAMAGVQTKLGAVQTQMTAFGNQLAGTAMLLAKVGAAAGVAGAVFGIKFAADLEQARIGFTTMLGSAEEAQKFLSQMQRFAAKTPFEFPELLDASRRLMAFGFEVEDVLPIVSAVGDAVAAMGGSSAQVERVTTALGQMRTAGRVGAQDMLQLTSAGIKAWEYLARAIGKTVPEVRKMAEDGQIEANAAIQAILYGMQTDFAGAMDVQSRSFWGLLSTMKDTARDVLGRIMQPLVDEMSRGLQSVALFVESAAFKQWADDTSAAFADAFNFLTQEAIPSAIGAMAYARDLWVGMGEAVQKAILGIGVAFVVAKATAMPEIAAIGAMLGGLIYLSDQAAAAIGSSFIETENGLQLLGEQTEESTEELKEFAAQGGTIGQVMSGIGDALKRKGQEAMEGMTAAMAEAKAEVMNIPKILAPAASAILASGKAAKDAADAFKEAGISAQSMAQAIAANHPAVLALGLRIVGLKDQLAATNAAIEANAAAQKAMQDAIRATQERISALNEKLSQAKQRLSDLAAPRLTGMGALDEQIFQAEQAIKRFQLLAAGGKLPTGIAAPKGNIADWQKLLERLRLQREVTYDPMLRQLQAAANPPAPEIGFGAAMAEIAATQATIASLQGQLASETATLRDQESALRSLQAEQDMLRESAAGLQAQIAQAEAAQRTMTDAIMTAIVWILEESGKMKKFGGEVAVQAGVVDEETKKMLKLFADFSSGHVATTVADINSVVSAWQNARDEIDRIAGGLAGGSGLSGAPALTVPAFQHGGIVSRPTLAMLGERGPEAIIPLTGGGAGYGASVVNVYVAGSVVAERDLAVAVRDELVRFQGRNRTTGIV